MTESYSSSRPSSRLMRRNSAPTVDMPTAATLTTEEPDFNQPLSRSAVMYPGSTTSTISNASNILAARTHQHRLNAAQEQRTYQDSCNRLLTHISSVMGICDDLKTKHNFSVRYPGLGINSSSSNHWRSTNNSATQQQQNNKPFNILDLDVKIGHATQDLSKLETQSIANLLDDKLSQCLHHLDNLRIRVADTSSKVLVTGDLNSGKSAFVNALLKRELMPVDQQPCTNMFCEVLDASLNDCFEEAHGIPDVEKYNRLDRTTYHVIEMRHLDKVITEVSEYKMLKVYARDARKTQDSLLHNGVVDIALIDSPGLNTDSVKTTAVFARQEEIDVVVFVVSAENHFTLSGKEFLLNAANEKTHIFIVVNRFDSIRDKDRCKRLVLEQIRQLSPATYADADDLVHFVSAGTVDLEPGSRKLDAPEFARLEQRLRAFVLENRSKSKLLPAKNYMVNLLKDIGVLSEANRTAAAEECARASHALEEDLPAYQNLLYLRDRLLGRIEKVAESSATMIQKHSVVRLNTAVSEIGKKTVEQLEYPGILLIWQYAQDLADSMSQQLLKDVRQVELQARHEASECIAELHQMGTEHLGDYDCVASVKGMCHKGRDRTVQISVDATDFFDLVVDDKVTGCALSVGAAVALGGRVMGVKDVVSNLWSMSSVMGTQNMRRLIVPVLSIASAGFLLYVVSDMRSAVNRKLVKKFKTAVRETSYVDAQGRRMARESRKVFRVEGWEVQARLQKSIESKERKREEMSAIVHTSQESLEYFTSVLEKSSMLLDKVSCVPTDAATSLHGNKIEMH
ncbi:hypothetical protein BDA99DRAFT_493449 [Phascolomyces articulosus]|uniref:Dynamin-type G domain-containing protein n=1 Tax=Phascolomyces articulosus TaxID=60185 RepID=A0AAD5PKX5_9FUNG|nr:hypothetical protein BDA99DRAFT_493449 [Phascolomyces articulosus]